jgi:hypothetical protein
MSMIAYFASEVDQQQTLKQLADMFATTLMDMHKNWADFPLL